MKKLITKFTSIIIALSVLMSITIPVSATDETLLTSYGAVPIIEKSKFLDDNGLKYKYHFVYRHRNYYCVFFINSNDISYLDLDYYYTYFKNTEDNSVTGDVGYIYFNNDGGYNSASIYNNYYLTTGYYYGYFYTSNEDNVSNFTKSIIYSDFPVKCDGLTVYDPADNQAVTIDGLLSLEAGSGSGEIVGPQKLPTDYQLYGTYMDKNEETWGAFIQWLIDNEYYTELATYGLTATADNIQSLANTWWENRFSATLFWNLVKTNGVNTLKNAENIIAWFNAKWQQYINHNYVKVPVGEEANSDPHHRAGLMTDKIDEDGNIIDSDEVSLLREIVRQLETLPLRISSSVYGVLYPLMSNMADNIYSLCLMTGNLPEYTANAIYNNFVESINLILNAIDNINSDSPLDNIFDDFYNKLLSVFIPDSEYMTSWENDVTGLIDSKFGFIGQLADLQQIINTYCFGTEQIVNYASVDDGQLEFDEYMNYPSFQIPAFDAGIISSKEPITIIDWSIIDEYRIYLHQIIVAVCYVTFISKRFKRTPNMIANNDIAD